MQFTIFHIYDNLSANLTGHIELDILKRLRNNFAHGIGTYNPLSSRDKKLMNDITKHFSFEKNEYPDFPINKDIVIKGIIEASKKYVKELFEQPNSKQQS